MANQYTKHPIPIEQRFWAKVDKSSDCWLWLGGISTRGYGKFWLSHGKSQGVTLLAHRASYEFHFGVIPKGMFICHKCDNPPCVRPDHLFLGTHADNMADCKRKGRAARGASHVWQLYPEKILRGNCHPRAKLTEDIVRQIRAEFNNTGRGHGIRTQIARRYGVSLSCVDRIVSGRTWTHVN